MSSRNCSLAQIIHGEYDFDVTHLSTVDNGKAMKYSLLISRHALAFGSDVIGCPTVAIESSGLARS